MAKQDLNADASVKLAQIVLKYNTETHPCVNLNSKIVPDSFGRQLDLNCFNKNESIEKGLESAFQDLKATEVIICLFQPLHFLVVTHVPMRRMGFRVFSRKFKLVVCKTKCLRQHDSIDHQVRP